MRISNRVVVTCLAAALCLVFTGTAAHGQAGVPIDSTHFWTWTIVPPYPSTEFVDARDQFFPLYRHLDSLVLERLLNPVVKFHNNRYHYPRDPELHMTWWRVKPPYRVDETVVYYDQFFPTGATVRVDTLSHLLVPARKRLQPPLPPLPSPDGPDRENHYLCYWIDGPFANRTVGLQDQFRSEFLPVYKADYLCAPCWKLHRGIQYPPRDSTHLVLYWVQAPTTMPRFPYINDQFLVDPHQFRVDQFREYLVVPALKKHVSTPTKRSSWGRIKTLYR